MNFVLRTVTQWVVFIDELFDLGVHVEHAHFAGIDKLVQLSFDGLLHLVGHDRHSADELHSKIYQFISCKTCLEKS